MKTLWQKIQYEYFGVDKMRGRYLKSLKEIGSKGMDWIYLVQNRD